MAAVALLLVVTLYCFSNCPDNKSICAFPHTGSVFLNFCFVTSSHYRKDVMGNETLELLPKEEFSNLVNVAKYADLGVWTAIQAAFCLGYMAGEKGLADRIERHFAKGGDGE